MTRHCSSSRRRLLLYAGGAVALGGCLGDGSVGGDGPTYEAGTVADADGDERTAAEMAAAAAVAETEITETVTPLAELSLLDHEFVVEDDFRRSTVQGRLENTGEDRIQTVEVRVRVYDDEDTNSVTISRRLATSTAAERGRSRPWSSSRPATWSTTRRQCSGRRRDTVYCS
ncbi:hypothetical protein SAMN05443661_12838 [Natronobacterium gregoryi]|uniref:Uncharacterized protein n=2 Tax=Natronobacterium gregoryi TaxID=44930 RepID=L0AK69_NATGS|nr:hypothetical protein Natgr_2700 [Natronobacterium gregoryi SP2]SFJ42494.1 hypothetical protein SAMN05443661_12838 [Natronobacterium gregoryi]